MLGELFIKLYDTYIPEPILGEINKIIRESGLDEPFDYLNSKYYVVAQNEEDTIGFVVYGEMKTSSGVYPRFLHIIITPKYKRTKLAYKMLVESEQELRKIGFDTILCFIGFDLENREQKKIYAEKFNYKKYAQDELGEFFYKQIKER